jgi:hypothetical protein
MFKEILKKLSSDPGILKKKCPEMRTFLHKQGNTGAQGVGNQPTLQEAAFASFLEEHLFKFIIKTETPTKPGFYYKYQLEGSQRSKDFMLISVTETDRKDVIVDLKHTTSKTFHLNDGWFEKDIVYIVSWTLKKANKIFIGLGQNIPTEEELLRFQELLKLKNEQNTKEKNKTGSLRTCVRFANTYSCNKFTNEYTEEHLTKTLNFVEMI